MKEIVPTAGLLLILLAPTSLFAEEELSFGVSAGTLVKSVAGFSGPEAVRYDPELDRYYVANFNGEATGDANGFVSLVSTEGEILELEFMRGTEDYPFHGGRGMYIDGSGLWVADASGIHKFDRRTGRHRRYVDFSPFNPGFVNDIVVVASGDIYVTDTGNSVLYKVSGDLVTIATETPFAANGITLNPETGNLILVPWSGSMDFVEWNVETGVFSTLGSASGGGNYDGVEVFGATLITASQTDTSLHMMVDGVDRRVIDLPGRPADIGIDTKRDHVAVPYVSLDRVDILSLRE